MLLFHTQSVLILLLFIPFIRFYCFYLTTTNTLCCQRKTKLSCPLSAVSLTSVRQLSILWYHYLFVIFKKKHFIIIIIDILWIILAKLIHSNYLNMGDNNICRTCLGCGEEMYPITNVISIADDVVCLADILSNIYNYKVKIYFRFLIFKCFYW